VRQLVGEIEQVDQRLASLRGGGRDPLADGPFLIADPGIAAERVDRQPPEALGQTPAPREVLNELRGRRTRAWGGDRRAGASRRMPELRLARRVTSPLERVQDDVVGQDAKPRGVAADSRISQASPFFGTT
jgi:hypothetical protein